MPTMPYSVSLSTIISGFLFWQVVLAEDVGFAKSSSTGLCGESSINFITVGDGDLTSGCTDLLANAIDSHDGYWTIRTSYPSSCTMGGWPLNHSPDWSFKIQPTDQEACSQKGLDMAWVGFHATNFPYRVTRSILTFFTTLGSAHKTSKTSSTMLRLGLTDRLSRVQPAPWPAHGRRTQSTSRMWMVWTGRLAKRSKWHGLLPKTSIGLLEACSMVW